MGMVQVLHYYCKRRRAELLNDITFKKGISCQIQTDFLDISDIVKELTNKNQNTDRSIVCIHNVHLIDCRRDPPDLMQHII